MARISKENREETKAKIIQEATLLFMDLGYTKANTKTLAQRCGIAEGTIFNYFATKDDVLMAVFETLALEPEPNKAPSPPKPLDTITDIIIVPLRKFNRIPKSFFMDIIISALKLSKKNKSLLHRLLTLDMSYIKKAEAQMQVLLAFDKTEMTAQTLSEILYATVLTEYLLYMLDEELPFSTFEKTIRNKLQQLMAPYLPPLTPQ